MESKSQAMEKAIDGQYYCEHPDKISSTMLYLFGCFIIFIIAYWISNNLVNRLLFLPLFLWQFLFDLLYQIFFPKYIIDRILSYIYISVCKSILSIQRIDFSLVTRNIFHTLPFIYISVSKSILSILKIDFSPVTRNIFHTSTMEKVASLFSHISPTQRLTTMEKLSPGSLSLSSFEDTIIILSFIGQIMLISIGLSLSSFEDTTIILNFSKYLDTSFFASAEFRSWLHILCKKVLINNDTKIETNHKQDTSSINNDTRTETKDIQIKRGEVEFVLSDIGISLSKEVDQIKDCMSHEEFSTLFDQTEPGLHEVEEAFSVFDQNRDGFIDAKELQTVLINLGLREGTDVNACQSMIDRHDRNCKGKIDQRDFFKLLESALL